jgi:LPS sulfotransferase NodH
LHRQQPFDLDATLEKLLPGANPAPEIPPRTRARLIFVVGMPRSGTTLVDQILSAHSRVVSLGEAHTALKLEKRLAVGTQGSQPTRPDEEAARGELAQWLRQQMKPPQDGLSVVDTSPGRFTQLGLLAELLPEAVFVHCTRNPLDTCVSIFEHPLSDAHGYANSLADLGCYYRAYQRLMAHWQAALGERFLEINYESLVSAPDTEIARLLAHCDLEFEDDCTRFYGHSRPVLTASAAQVRQPINTRSVGRWRAYQRFLKPLLDQFPSP